MLFEFDLNSTAFVPDDRTMTLLQEEGKYMEKVIRDA
jgi:hypothetical protein